MYQREYFVKKYVKKQIVVNCSSFEPSKENLAKLNEYFQKNKIADFQINYERYGPDHQPMFTGFASWQHKKFVANASTKKEVEHKIKSHLWQSCFEKKRVQPAKTKPPQDLKVVSYKNFREVLNAKEGAKDNSTKPVLIIDLTSFDVEDIEDESEEHCLKSFSKIVVFTNEKELKWDKVVHVKLSETELPIIQECLNRIVYYLLDKNQEKEIQILTTGQYPYLITEAAKTQQKVEIITDLNTN